LLIGSASIAVVDDVLKMCRNSQRSTALDGRFSGNHEVQQVSFITCHFSYCRLYMYRDSMDAHYNTAPSLTWNQVNHGNHAPEPRETSRDQ